MFYSSILNWFSGVIILIPLKSAIWLVRSSADISPMHRKWQLLDLGCFLVVRIRDFIVLHPIKMSCISLSGVTSWLWYLLFSRAVVNGIAL